MMLMLCYGCGLRVSKVISVWVRHIDGKRHLLRIEQTKGAKDRSVILSDHVSYAMRDYWWLYRPAHWLFSGEQPDRPLSPCRMRYGIVTNASRRFSWRSVEFI